MIVGRYLLHGDLWRGGRTRTKCQWPGQNKELHSLWTTMTCGRHRRLSGPSILREKRLWNVGSRTMVTTTFQDAWASIAISQFRPSSLVRCMQLARGSYWGDIQAFVPSQCSPFPFRSFTLTSPVAIHVPSGGSDHIRIVSELQPRCHRSNNRARGPRPEL